MEGETDWPTADGPSLPTLSGDCFGGSSIIDRTRWLRRRGLHEQSGRLGADNQLGRFPFLADQKCNRQHRHLRSKKPGYQKKRSLSLLSSSIVSQTVSS